MDKTSIKLLDRTGETNYNKSNNRMTIIKYNSAINILVKFDTGDIIKSTYNNFKNGCIKSYYDRTICDIGFLGEGKHVLSPTKINPNSKQAYRIWKGLFDRCYKHYNESRNYVYNNCEISDEWECFNTFADWYFENFYEIKGQTMCLDKDILHKGNKIYSPETCVFVPQIINKLFTKSDKARGKLPIGVQYETLGYRADITTYNFELKQKKRKYLGHFNTKEEAFNAYKIAKESNIKRVADYYKNKIPKKLYDAMYKYEVEITD